MIQPSFWAPPGGTPLQHAPPQDDGLVRKDTRAKSLTVVFVTCRPQACVEWFVASLVPQIHSWEDVQVIIVDALAQSVSSLPKVGSLKSITITPPKPNLWQGPHRMTRENWWAKCNALNTAVCLCRTEWLAFVDDRCVVLPGWMQAVRDAMAGDYAVCGAYEKRHEMRVENGVIVHGGIVTGQDNRETGSGGSAGPRIVNGGWWYGCTNALPLEWLLGMNGFPEKCDSVSFEDVITGMLLYNRGRAIKYDPGMKVVEDRTPAACGDVFKRSCKEKHPHDLNDKTHHILNWAKTATTSDNPYNLRELREQILAGKDWPVPDRSIDWRDWFDGQPLAEM